MLRLWEDATLMPKASPHFARIKQDIMAIVATIPKGRLTTYKAIGTHLDVMPRHVAYILADSLMDMVPWYRVVAERGQLTKGQRAGDQQLQLKREGHRVDEAGCVMNFEAVFIAPSDLETDVPKQRRAIKNLG
jgi:methylated-DNA-protein-cysteine methyltransferase related protein